jgi:hypothetical protein
VTVGRLCELLPVIERERVSVGRRVDRRRLLDLLRRSFDRAVGGGGLEALPQPVTVGRFCELLPVIERERVSVGRRVDRRRLLDLLRRSFDRAVGGGGLEALPLPVTAGRRCELVPVIENPRYPTVAVDVTNNLAGPGQFRLLFLVLAARRPVGRKMRPKEHADSSKVPTTGRSRLRRRYKIRGSRLDSGQASRTHDG